MSLAGFSFLTFLAFAYLTWRFLVRGEGPRKVWLLFLSYAFYCTWDARFALVLAGITVAQWWFGGRIHSAPTSLARRAWLGTSVVVALGCLGYFKYSAFFVEGLRTFLVNLGLGSIAPAAHLVAPLGISFFTFQSLTYTIDLYRGLERPARLLDFSLFIAFFPHIAAGPIGRARFLIPQFERRNDDRAGLDAEAVYLLARGLVKKVAIADVLSAQFVTPALASPGAWSSTFLLLAVLAYSFQIYMDLSGYTDLARGSARVFGYDLQVNFDRPYLARTVSNFWQRWHISMSGFFREYLFWSLGGSRRGNVYVNLMLTFVAIGLWHGAGLNFLVYGMLHGGAVCLERVVRGWRRKRGRPTLELPSGLAVCGIAYTFIFVALARILFISPDFESAFQYLRMIASSTANGFAAGPQGCLTLVVAIALHFVPRQFETRLKQRFFAWNPILVAASTTALIYALVVLGASARPFVYFQF